ADQERRYGTAGGHGSQGLPRQEVLGSVHDCVRTAVQCRRFEVPTPPAANSSRNFKSKSGTRIINLLVPLCFRSSCRVVLQCITNFEGGALVLPGSVRSHTMIRSLVIAAVVAAPVAAGATYAVSQQPTWNAIAAWIGWPERAARAVLATENWPICSTMAAM